jgi:lipopolysaccharide export system permease protein
MSQFITRSARLMAILALAAAGAALCAWLLPGELRVVREHLAGFPDADAAAHGLRPIVLAALCFLPALGAFFYALGGELDRYIARQFIHIFCICLGSLLMIWLLIDLSDKVGDLQGAKNIFASLIAVYSARAPAVLLLLLPYGLLLSMLYCLSQLSASREVIAMIQSGRGIVRITLPLVIAGIICTLFGIGLNYQWAPVAEGRQDEVMAEAKGEVAQEASRVLFNNAPKSRVWMIGAFPHDYQKGAPLKFVEITTSNAQNQIETRLSADSASWDPATRQWTFENATVGTHRESGPPDFKKSDGPLVIDSFEETPMQLIKPGLSAEQLGIPDLNGWLKARAEGLNFADPAPYRTEWHHRWAMPFTCIVSVMLAVPLAVNFSRRGPAGSIILAVGFSAIMLLISTIVLAFGHAGDMSPVVAAWLPNFAFFALGVYLFKQRIHGRPLFKRSRKTQNA